ncbi:MAG: 3-coathanger stack domain-containing protein, partial [Bacteroidota bacterium]
VNTRLYIDMNDNCDLIALHNSHALLYGYERLSMVIPTIKDARYAVAISSSSSSYYSDKRITVRLLPSGENNNPCNLILPESTKLSYGYSLRIPLNVSNENSSFNIDVLDHENKSSRTRYRNLFNGEHFNVSTISTGNTVIEFNNDKGCYGHGLLNVEVTNLPRDPCSNEVLLCEELIEHFEDDELTDSIYQALSIESSAIVSLESNVQYLAEDEVLLLPGFETEDDSDFTADIVECEVAENSEEDNIEERSIEEVVLKQEAKLTTAPNPFTNFTNIQYQIPEQSEANLLLFNAQGQLVQSIVSARTLEVGKYNATLDGGNLEGGLYFLILQTTKEKIVRKLVVVK